MAHLFVRLMRKLLLGSAAVLAFGIASAGAERWEPSQEDFKQMETMTAADFVALCRKNDSGSVAEQKCNAMLDWVRKNTNAQRPSCVSDRVTPTQLWRSIVPELESFMTIAPDARNMRAYQAISGLLITKYCAR